MKTFDLNQIIHLENIKHRLDKDICGLTIEKLFEIEQALYFEQYRQQLKNQQVNQANNQDNFDFVVQY